MNIAACSRADTHTALCITAEFLGASRHLVVHDDNHVTWSASVPKDAWVLDTSDRWPERDLAVLAHLAGIELNFPDGPSLRAMSCLGLDVEHVPWTMALPSWKLRNMTQDLLCDVRRALDSPDRGYYVRTFEPSRRLLSTLARCKVDVARLEHHAHEGDGNQDALETFMPQPDGLARQPVYELYGGRTGRLKICAGPQLLTLKREHRDIITSRFNGGKVFLLDYASLEARIAAIEAGHIPPEDVYTDLSECVLGGVSRSVAKLAVLATIFGAGSAMLDGHVEPGTAEWLKDKLVRHFRVPRLTTKLRLERDTGDGSIRNKLGRRIECPPTAHILYNSYIQSTGVDVALHGFMKIVEEMRKLAMQSSPIFVLHDALVIDFHPEELVYINRLCEVGSHIRGYDCKFPIKAKEIAHD